MIPMRFKPASKPSWRHCRRGKFGLGMKSVFHFCEAFWHFTSSNQPASEGGDFSDWLNPWSGSVAHEDWDEVDEHLLRAQLEQIKSWPHGAERRFCLWLPLRQRESLYGKTPIVTEYRRVEDFLKPELSREIINLFPLLRSLSSVSVWSRDDGRFKRQCTFSLPCTRPV